jgi:hypothetical protein
MPSSPLHKTLAELAVFVARAVNENEAAAAARIAERLRKRLRGGYGTRTCAYCGLTWRPKSENPRRCGCCNSRYWRGRAVPRAVEGPTVPSPA